MQVKNISEYCKELQKEWAEEFVKKGKTHKKETLTATAKERKRRIYEYNLMVKRNATG
jgi:hypothetical protein